MHRHDIIRTQHMTFKVVNFLRNLINLTSKHKSTPPKNNKNIMQTKMR
jgi:hypothetical protein